MIEHLRAQLANVLDRDGSPSMRATHARSVAETAQDLRDAVRAGEIVLRGGRVWSMVTGEDESLREALTELRDLGDWPGLLQTNVLDDGRTGYGPVPLIRQVADPWPNELQGTSPIVPGFTTSGPFAGVDPTLPLTPDADGILITDVGTGEHRHWSVLTFELSKQIVDYVGPTGRALLDRIVLDEVDLAAEKFVAAALVAAAGGTRAAGSDLAAALDDAEASAGVRGPVELLVLNAADVPAVRRALAPTFFDGPHPETVVSAGQPAGTATFVGGDAMRFFVDDYVRQQAPAVRTLGLAGAVARPFYLAVRDGVGVQTVTGIGA